MVPSCDVWLQVEHCRLRTPRQRKFVGDSCYGELSDQKLPSGLQDYLVVTVLYVIGLIGLLWTDLAGANFKYCNRNCSESLE